MKKRKILILSFFLFIIVLLAYVFFLTKSQALWFDEAEYMSMAKHMAFGTPDAGFAAAKPMLFPMFLSSLLALGFGELGIRIVMLAFAFGSIALLFFLGKKLFDWKTAIIASFFFSIFYITLLYSTRLMTEMPSMFLELLMLYCFFSKKAVWLIVPLGLAAALLRFPNALFLIIIILYMILFERKDFSDKKFCISALISILIAIALFIAYLAICHLSVANFLNAVSSSGSSALRAPDTSRADVIGSYLAIFSSSLGLILLIAFISSIIMLLISKIHHTELLVLWMLVPFIYYGFFVNHSEDRYLFIIFPAVFMAIGFGISQLWGWYKKWTDKNAKIITLALMIIILIMGTIYLAEKSDSIIKSKVSVYNDLKEAGLWVKYHSLQGDAVLSPAMPVIAYYSERHVYFHGQGLEEETNKVIEYNAGYIIITNWEKSPSWLDSYLRSNQTAFKPVFKSNSTYMGQNTFAIVYEAK